MKLAILIFFKFIKRQARIIGLILALFLSLIFLQIRFNLFQSANYLSEGFIGTYQEHDMPEEVKGLLSEGLIKVDNQGRIKPNLAMSWDINNDATIFRFFLSNDLHWSDGTKIKSYDIEFNIPDAQITTADDRTIQFTLKEPYSPFPSLLTKPVFKKGTKIGTGPYKINSLEKSRIFITKITLESNNKSLPNIYIRFYPSEKVAQTGFYMGEVQSLFGLTNPQALLNNSLVVYKHKTDFSKIVTILYNTHDQLLSNKSLRQALSYQTPKIEGEEEANAPYPKSFWAYTDETKRYLSQFSEAQAALKKAKTNLSDDKIKTGISLTTTPNLEEVAKMIATSWEKLGINVKLRVESGIPQNFQSLLITQSIPQDPDQYFLWHSTQINTNLSKYSPECCPSSARVDKDLEDGRKAITEEDRKEKYHDFHKVLMEDAPATFLYFPKYNVIYLKKAENNLNKIVDLQLAN